MSLKLSTLVGNTVNTTIPTTKIVSVATNTQLVANTAYRITSPTAITVTLPSAPATGDYVVIKDGDTITDTVTHTVARNGKDIMGVAQDLVLNISLINLELWFNGSEWRINKTSLDIGELI